MRLLFLVLLGISRAKAQTYAVLAPDVVRPNSDFLVAVSVFNLKPDEQQDVELRIRGRSLQSSQTIEIRQDTSVRSDTTEIVRIRIGDLGEGSYSLTARGSFPLTFDQTQKLNYVHKGYSVFIQTDKAIYRPGNVVRFRAVVVTPQLKPSVVGSIDVVMTDGGGNIVRRWDRVFTTKGVFAGQLEVAQVPVLGDWNITVDVSGQLFSKSFQVAEYVLPKFRVSIDLPDYGTLDETTTAPIVRASYAFGGPVVGEATMSIYPVYKSSTLQPFNSEPLRKVVSLQGRVEMPFENLATQLGLEKDFDRQVVFDVKVKEAGTGRIQNVTRIYHMYRHDFKMQLVKTSEAFKPGLPYTVFLKVAHQDDTPVQDDLNLVSVKWGFGTDTESYNNTEYPIPEDGIIELRFNPPPSGVDLLGIEATYKGLVQWFSTVPVASSRSGRFLQAMLRTRNPKVGENLRIGIVSTHPLTRLNYAIFGRGKLIFASTLEGVATDTYNEINFRANADVAPQCRVIVYALLDGEIVADSVDFEVDGTLTNYVEIFASRRQTLPGKDVTVNVKTQPNSFVGLMAVEKSVLAFTPGHDITMSDVINELRGYDSAVNPDFFPWFRVVRPLKGYLYWHTGSSGAQNVFSQSGTILMTNAHVQPGRRSTNAKVVHHGENRPLGRPLPSPDDRIVNPDQGPGVIYETVTRPPLAGPYAFSYLPQPVDNRPKLYLQSDLPDTWLFINTTTDLDGKASIPVKAPELANSSWTISGFSIDDLFGMGITQEAGNLEIFQPFYVKVDLPHLVRRGETVAIQMVVYNYLTREITAEVTLENTEDSAFLFGNQNINDIDGTQLDIELFQTKQVQIKPGRGTLLQFLITPLKIGLLDLKITAKSSVGQDILIKGLRVEAEGQTVRVNKPLFLDMRSKTSLESNITVQIPKPAIQDSQKVFLTAVADPMGTVMNNLAELLGNQDLSNGGSGDQNLLHLLPPAIVAAYLQETDRFSGEIALTATQLMEKGYQRQLTYRLSDGSFTSFGPAYDRRGSVWITALTISAFRQIQPFIDVGENIINGANEWLINSQKPDGSFPETGNVVIGRLQDNAITMTAFVVISLVENKVTLDTSLRNSLNRAINYLAENFDAVDDDDTYTLSLVTFAFHRAFHPRASEGLRKLNALATLKDGFKFWELPLENFEKENPWTQTPNSANIEMTSYALLSLFLSDENGRDFDENIPIVEWLLTQQSIGGGFTTTVDTFIALSALAEFSRKLRIVDRGSAINLQYSFENTVRRLEISAEASTLLQRRILLPETKEIQIRASGGGIGLVQIGYEFNLAVNGAWPSFVVNPLVFKATSPNQLKLSVCTHYIQSGSVTSSNMAVMEVNLPSGFTIDKDSLPALRRFKGVKRVDPSKGDTQVVLYFESLGRSEICPTISAYRTYRVANQKPAYVEVFDFYDQARRARSFYQVDPSTLCDICDDCYVQDCGDKPTFLNYESFQFGSNVDFHSEAVALHVPKAGLVMNFVILLLLVVAV